MVPEYNRSGNYRSKLIALLLWWFLSEFGAHNFYLGRKSQAWTELGLFFVGAFTLIFGVGAILLLAWVVLVIIDLIKILIVSEPDFDWGFN